MRESYLQGKWVMTTEEPSTWRRSVYAYWKRGLKYPMFEVHDQPDPNVTCEMRNTTTVPTQALTLLNNEFVLIQARHFAERVVREAGTDPAKQIRVLYQIALAREPSPKEMNRSLTFLRKQRDYHAGKASGADSGLPALTDGAHLTRTNSSTSTSAVRNRMYCELSVRRCFHTDRTHQKLSASAYIAGGHGHPVRSQNEQTPICFSTRLSVRSRDRNQRTGAD